MTRPEAQSPARVVPSSRRLFRTAGIGGDEQRGPSQHRFARQEAGEQSGVESARGEVAEISRQEIEPVLPAERLLR